MKKKTKKIIVLRGGPWNGRRIKVEPWSYTFDTPCYPNGMRYRYQIFHETKIAKYVGTTS